MYQTIDNRHIIPALIKDWIHIHPIIPNNNDGIETTTKDELDSILFDKNEYDVQSYSFLQKNNIFIPSLLIINGKQTDAVSTIMDKVKNDTDENVVIKYPMYPIQKGELHPRRLSNDEYILIGTDLTLFGEEIGNIHHIVPIDCSEHIGESNEQSLLNLVEILIHYRKPNRYIVLFSDVNRDFLVNLRNSLCEQIDVIQLESNI